jgi:cell division protein FtsI (penicillin-binding protein 3)
MKDPKWAHEYDSLWTAQIDSTCEGLHKIFTSQSAAEFRAHLEAGRNKIIVNKKTGEQTKGARYWKIWKRRVDYNTYLKVKALPLFNLPPAKGGFNAESFNTRRHPFGSLAIRTVGDIGSDKVRNAHGRVITKDSARFGIELACDTLLRGTPGIERRQKVLNKKIDLTVTPPVSGGDIVTTIDVNMQDMVERAVIEEMKLPEVNADMGVAILMEVKTGDVKAIANIEKTESGHYMELYNRAISYRCEPGSVFKVASFLVALDDGVIPHDTSYVIHTGCGIREMHGRLMKDHNWRRGGYQDISVARTLEVSSNIGTSHVIDQFYGGHPEKYVQGLRRVGIGEDLKLPLVGYRKPVIRDVDTKTTDRSRYWSKTTLPWMSIGYETQIAPINTVTFYNAIANGGKMMQPRFVTKLVKDGETIREFPPVVLKERIAKKETITMMQTILEHVVSQGLGRKAAPLSRAFKVAGKTGTAQIADEHGGYHSGTTRYWLSFAGFFPADNPRYTCIVCLRKTGLPASGGGMSGVVFRHIAEGVMAQNVKRLVDDVRDSTSSFTPDVKPGDEAASSYILGKLGLKANKANGANKSYAAGLVPDVTGMGARDAVYEMERRGMKVVIHGRGKVKSQSIAAGTTAERGAVCNLYMDI